MSFVSIVVRKTWISVVSDGRCMSGNKILDENYQKFVKPAENRFTAFAGDKNRCELVIRAMREMGHDQLGLEDSARHMAGLVQEIGRRGFSVFVAAGGIGVQGAEVYAFSTQSDQPQILKPNSMELSFAFLSHHGVSEESLNQEFAKLIRTYGDSSPAKVAKAQIELNSWVANQDRSVNKTTFTCQLQSTDEIC